MRFSSACQDSVALRRPYNRVNCSVPVLDPRNISETQFVYEAFD